LNPSPQTLFARPFSVCTVPEMRLDDPSDNGGRGWRRLTSQEIADLAYIAIRLVRRAVRANLSARDAAQADEAARKLAEAVSSRLAAYLIFGPASAARGHSAGGGSDPERR
jgi:hypothetical protein